MPQETVKIKIDSWRGVEGRTSYAPGTWDVDPVTAGNLIAKGRAKRVGGAAPVVKRPKATDEGKALAPGADANPPALEPENEPSDNGEGATELPEDFPNREALIAAGFDTVEKLKADNIREELGKPEGFSPADVTKVGLAISKI